MKKLLLSLILAMGMALGAHAQNPTLVYGTNGVIIIPPNQHAGKVTVGFTNSPSFNNLSVTGILYVGTIYTANAYITNQTWFATVNANNQTIANLAAATTPLGAVNLTQMNASNAALPYVKRDGSTTLTAGWNVANQITNVTYMANLTNAFSYLKMMVNDGIWLDDDTGGVPISRVVNYDNFLGDATARHSIYWQTGHDFAKGLTICTNKAWIKGDGTSFLGGLVTLGDGIILTNAASGIARGTNDTTLAMLYLNGLGGVSTNKAAITINRTSLATGNALEYIWNGTTNLCVSSNGYVSFGYNKPSNLITIPTNADGTTSIRMYNTLSQVSPTMYGEIGWTNGLFQICTFTNGNVGFGNTVGGFRFAVKNGTAGFDVTGAGDFQPIVDDSLYLGVYWKRMSTAYFSSAIYLGTGATPETKIMPATNYFGNIAGGCVAVGTNLATAKLSVVDRADIITNQPLFQIIGNALRNTNYLEFVSGTSIFGYVDKNQGFNWGNLLIQTNGVLTNTVSGNLYASSIASADASVTVTKNNLGAYDLSVPNLPAIRVSGGLIESTVGALNVKGSNINFYALGGALTNKVTATMRTPSGGMTIGTNGTPFLAIITTNFPAITPAQVPDFGSWITNIAWPAASTNGTFCRVNSSSMTSNVFLRAGCTNNGTVTVAFGNTGSAPVTPPVQKIYLTEILFE